MNGNVSLLGIKDERLVDENRSFVIQLLLMCSTGTNATDALNKEVHFKSIA